MANRQHSRNPPCPIFATKLKEINRLPRLDVNVKGFSTFTDNADEFGDDFGKYIIATSESWIFVPIHGGICKLSR